MLFNSTIIFQVFYSTFMLNEVQNYLCRTYISLKMELLEHVQYLLENTISKTTFPDRIVCAILSFHSFNYNSVHVFNKVHLLETSEIISFKLIKCSMCKVSF